MRERIRKSDMSSLLALLLFAVFSVCILSVLLTGADAYQRLVRRDQDSYDARTAELYLSTRVRQADSAGGVWVGSFDGVPGETGEALFLEEQGDYHTRIYCSGGYIRELFSASEDALSPEDGETILAAQALTFSQSGGRVTAVITQTDGSTMEVVLDCRGGEVYAP